MKTYILLDFFEATLNKFRKLPLMLHKIILLVSLLVVSTFAGAQPVQVNPGHPEQYVVQKGDTLWSISSHFLMEPWRWLEIVQVNPQISNPNLIYPGDIISLSYNGDSPVLSINRPSGSAVSATSRTVKLSPEIRSEENDQAIPSIPIDVIRQFLTRPLIMGESEMNNWPYVITTYEQRLVGSPGVEIYVKCMVPPMSKK